MIIRNPKKVLVIIKAILRPLPYRSTNNLDFRFPHLRCGLFDFKPSHSPVYDSSPGLHLSVSIPESPSENPSRIPSSVGWGNLKAVFRGVNTSNSFWFSRGFYRCFMWFHGVRYRGYLQSHFGVSSGKIM